MRLSRTDFVPVLTIVAGGVIGASLSFSLLERSRSADVPAPYRVVWLSDDVPVTVGTVSGQVTDAHSGVSIAAAQVYISSLELGGLSQQDGRYLLQNVPVGTYTLTVARTGYRTREEQITVSGGQTVEHNFSVAEEVLQLDEIIAGAPGCTQASGSSINIRGFSSIEIGNQPLIYVDGIRVDSFCSLGPENFPGILNGRDASGSGASALDDINPEDIESIEIIKGPAAATLYGTEASAGVIQITLKEDRPQR